MKISVITVCKNADAYIEDAIKSVVNQTYPDVEYLIIDGQSSDRTLDIVHRYADRIATVVSEADGGIYAAMNKGIRMATGDFLYFLNSDDYLIDSTVFAELADFIAQQPACDFVYGQMEMRIGAKQRRDRRIPRPPAELQTALMGYSEGPQHAASFFGRRLIDRLGLFDESYRISADYDWFLRVAQTPDAAVCYFPRMIASCSNQGFSCREQTLSLKEFFRVQNTAPLYQQPDWMQQRIYHLQEQIIFLYELLNKPSSPPANTPTTPAQTQALLAQNEALRHQLNSLLATTPDPTSSLSSSSLEPKES